MCVCVCVCARASACVCRGSDAQSLSVTSNNCILKLRLHCAGPSEGPLCVKGSCLCVHQTVAASASRRAGQRRESEQGERVRGERERGRETERDREAERQGGRE